MEQMATVDVAPKILTREESAKLPGPIPGTGIHHSMSLKSQDVLIESGKRGGVVIERTLLRKERAVMIDGDITCSPNVAWKWLFEAEEKLKHPQTKRKGGK